MMAGPDTEKERNPRYLMESETRSPREIGKKVLWGMVLSLVVVSAGLLGLGLAGAASTSVIIKALYYDTYLSGEPDEAIQVSNISPGPIDVTGWTLTDGEGTVTLSGTLAAGQSIWLAREADDFYLEFGFKPDYEYQADTDGVVPDLPRTGTFTLANSGDQLLLKDADSALIDSVVYEGGSTAGVAWSGATLDPYNQGYFGLEGQILYRKLDPATGLPVADSDTASDWAQATDDDINGKKVQYPGWDLERYFFTHQLSSCPEITS